MYTQDVWTIVKPSRAMKYSLKIAVPIENSWGLKNPPPPPKKRKNMLTASVLRVKIAILVYYRAQHQWQPKGDQKLTGGTNWTPQVTQSMTWTQPTFQQSPQHVGDLSRGMRFPKLWHFDMCRLGRASAASF